MLRFFGLSAMGALLLGFVAALPAQTVDGAAVNSATGAGVAGVHVTFQPGGGGGALSYDAANDPRGQLQPYEADTDARGQFHIEGVKGGRYFVSCQLDGYASCIAQPGSITAGSAPVTLQLRLTPESRIAGRVLDGNGHPVPDAAVELATDSDTGPAAAQVSDQVSEKDGSFGFERLRAGSYTLVARAPRNWAPPEPADGQTLAWAATFYPSAVFLQSAAKIRIDAGSDFPSANITLRAVPERHVRGVVLNPSGDPAPDASVKLSAECKMSLEQGSVRTGEDGAFDLTAVDGSWCLSAGLRKGEADLEALEAVQVSGDDPDPVKLQLRAPFSIRASVVYDPPLPADYPYPPRIRVALDAKGRVTTEASNADGGDRFTIGAIYKDRYTVTVPGALRGNYAGVTAAAAFADFLKDPLSKYYLASIRLAGQDGIGNPLEISSGDDPLEIRYEAHGGTVRGSVEGGGATVVLVSREPGLPLPSSVRVVISDASGHLVAGSYTKATDAFGHFEITGVRPGRYSVIAQRFSGGAVSKASDPVDIAVGPEEVVTVGAIIVYRLG